MDKKKTVNLSLKQYGMVFAMIIIFIVFYVLTGGTNATPMNINNLIMQNSYVIILATGMLLCVLTGNVDLGVGSYVALCGAVAGKLIVEQNMSIPVAILAALAVGAIFGAFNGFFIAYDRDRVENCDFSSAVLRSGEETFPFHGYIPNCPNIGQRFFRGGKR